MRLDHVTYSGGEVTDEAIFPRLPPALAGLLRQLNGFVQFHGGLHVRGAVLDPWWHSIRHAWEGSDALSALYPTVSLSDVPFAEDCLGDQFLLREGLVCQLSGETGELEHLELTFGDWLERVQGDPVHALSLHPLLQFQSEGGSLVPGELLAAYPPFCTKEAAEGVTLAAVPAQERRRFLAHMAAALRDVPEGGHIKFEIGE